MNHKISNLAKRVLWLVRICTMKFFSFIDCVRAITMNKQTFDEALIILKKKIDAKEV